MTNRWIPTALVLACTLGAAAAQAAPPASPTPDDPLAALAAIAAETPRTTFALGLAGAAACGVEGHCSFTTCNAPDCEPGKTPVCNCVSSGDTCDDAHNPWNPFDDDSHAVFNCNCGCVGEDPEPCRVRDPLNPDECLLEGSNHE